MNQSSFNFNEFIEKPVEQASSPVDSVEQASSPAHTIDNDLTVQKVVVEELAAEKAELNEKMSRQESDLLALKTKYENTQRELETKKAEVFSLKAEVEALKANQKALESKLAAEAAKTIDLQERNPNALALLDRDVDIPDRFPGETRDHVLEVVREARNKAESDGRLRRAQVLESVLVANEPNGTLAKMRESLQKLFTENGNLITGPVMEELQRLGIPHKNGEEYLLPAEILKRTY